jgi:hypothetical protein
MIPASPRLDEVLDGVPPPLIEYAVTKRKVKPGLSPISPGIRQQSDRTLDDSLERSSS